MMSLEEEAKKLKLEFNLIKEECDK